MLTFTFDPDDETELRAMADEIPMPNTLLVKAPFS
jgi:hypothetical protein